MKILKEFKAFAMQGNVVELAVAVIIGAAFGNIISSFVTDIIMPPIGLLLGGLDFKDLVFVLKTTAEGSPLVTLKYGQFVNALIDFIIIAFTIFMVVKGINSMKKKEEEKPAPPPAISKEVELLSEIRDLLSKK
ncbi:MAG: large-conductance mechanosensitive channel protein MscL [Ignavibacteriaceae bacterium]